MKKQLTKEQSARLIELGVAKEKASAIEQIPDYDYPLFTFADLLEIILEFFEGKGLRVFKIKHENWSLELTFYGKTTKEVSQYCEPIDDLYDLLIGLLQ